MSLLRKLSPRLPHLLLPPLRSYPLKLPLRLPHLLKPLRLLLQLPPPTPQLLPMQLSLQLLPLLPRLSLQLPFQLKLPP
ncbi:MAG: hypothetical protein ACLQAH_05525 [Limisphaerales bacterium]